ncbi:hypothetical protein phiAS5_ORF0229 [Aeromonas phage phiAS5]|uniref:Uncharacterized protein n=1 Tax=Aeromonas phage phiAS5 TaxID=879630 RepID=E1A1Y3_9CAUD|nr:hypothetical protein phiAS5_ORF0229 [Aeromonas phage phiAS5]ADM80072.1 hypothetical protein phiAS5_ORF0229 [Aeromonas phage phiAS5]BES53162.1 hypothetical protein [Aeromonas phage phiWae14]
MNGRRVRRVRPSKVLKMNQQLQLINDSIAEANRILNAVERTVLPGDWMNGRIHDNFCYNTWRTVGCLNLSDHFLVRYMERVRNYKFNEEQIKLEYGLYPVTDSDMMKIRWANRHGLFTEKLQNEIREYVKNPPADVRIIRQEDRVITLLTFEDQS